MTVVYFIVLVGVLIFVHELGHFLFAKLFDVKVLKFSLGFGPRAAGFHWGETEYKLSWLPLGGYVKMLGEDPTDGIRKEDQGRAFHQKPGWQRFIIFFAGPAFNIVFPTLIYFIFFSTQARLDPPIIGKVLQGQPAAEAGLQPGDKIVSIDGNAVKYWHDPSAAGGGLWSVTYNISRRPGEALKFRVERGSQIIDRYITPKEYVRYDRVGSRERYGMIGISPFFELPQIGISDPQSAAATAGLRTGDLITAVNSHATERWGQLQQILSRNRGEALRIAYVRPSPSISRFVDLRLLKPHYTVLYPEPAAGSEGVKYKTGLRSAELFVQRVDARSPAAQIGLQPGDRLLTIDGKVLTDWAMLDASLRSAQLLDHDLEWIGSDGRQRSARFRLAKVTEKRGDGREAARLVFGAHNGVLWRTAEPVEIHGRIGYAAVESVRKTADFVGMMSMVIVQLIRGDISRDTIGGPVMLAYVARDAAARGLEQFLNMMALISINLGMINLLPIPILDGGHILFLAIETIKRRPLSLRARELASYVGLVLLIFLMAFALKNDIVRYWFR